MSPKKRGAELDKYSCEYIVYGDFERHAPYSFNTTAYWVTLSKMVEDVKKKKAEAEIEIFEGNLEMNRKGEIEELPSGSESGERGGGGGAVILRCSVIAPCIPLLLDECLWFAHIYLLVGWESSPRSQLLDPRNIL